MLLKWFFVVGSGGLLLLPPLSCSRVHVQRRCLLHSYLYIFFLLFLHVFKVGYFFQRNSLLAHLSLSAFLGPSYLLHLRPFLLT